MDIGEAVKSLEGFVWDKGNIDKNWIRHKVLAKECEEVFFQKPLLLVPDTRHAEKEIRFQILGKTRKGRCLFASFTIRNNKVRIISARDQSRKERSEYEKQI